MIVIAIPEEIKLLKLTDWDSSKQLILTGVGGTNIIKSLMNVDRETPILNIGYAGSSVIPVGKRVSIRRVQLYHPNVEFEEQTWDLGGEVDCFTSGDFVTMTKIKEPCVFDMELAYILALGFKNVRAEKIVSDVLNIEEFFKTKQEEE